MSMKNPLTPAGIEPASFRFVAQNLNHCATAIPRPYLDTSKLLDGKAAGKYMPRTQQKWQENIVIDIK